MILPAAAGTSCSLFFTSTVTNNQPFSLCGSSKIQKTNTKSRKIVVVANPWLARQVRVRAQSHPESMGDTKVDQASSIDGKIDESSDDVPIMDGKSTNPFRGRFVDGFRVFRQKYLIASYQVGEHAKLKMGSIMNILQDAPMGRTWVVGITIGEFGATSEMIKKNVTWVVFRVRIVINRYPLWGDIIEVDNSMTSPPGSNTIRSDCTFRNEKTKETLIRATTQFVLMNKTTRRLSKVTQEMRDEAEAYNHHVDPIIDEKIVRLPPFDVKSAQYVQNGIVPKWDDIDLNGHVNSSGYMDWIIQSTPRSVLERHEVADVIMEFHKECGIDSVVRSLTSFVDTNNSNNNSTEDTIEMDHLILLQSGPKVLRARTVWRPKRNDNAPIFSGGSDFYF